MSLVAACFCAPAFAQEEVARVGVSKRALEMRMLPGIGFLEPQDILMCQALVGPVVGTFAPEEIEPGKGFGFVVGNSSEVPVTVTFETRDAEGTLQGALVTQVGPASVRRLSLLFWTDTSVGMSTQVRITPLQDTADLNVVVGQEKIVEATDAPGASGQVMDCSAQGCTLRVVDPGLEGPNPDGPQPSDPSGLPGAEMPDGIPGQGTGPHGPHVVNPGDEQGAAMPDGFPAEGGTGPHGPHRAGAKPVQEQPADGATQQPAQD